MRVTRVPVIEAGSTPPSGDRVINGRTPGLWISDITWTMIIITAEGLI